MKTNETVILIHGLGGTGLDMWPIARKLKRLGYVVRNWTYRSVGKRIETHAERLVSELETLDVELHQGRFHLVTHSMGGIIARTAMAQGQFEKLGRVVMLAPPHQGSHAARMLAPYFGWLSPSLGQLSDHSDSFVKSLTNPFAEQGIEFGIIEATKDRVIAAGAVHLDGYQDFASVNGHHAILTWYPQTTRFIENFLAHGRFENTRMNEDEPVRHPVDVI